MAAQGREPVDVPLNYPCTTVFLDESGVKAKDRFTVGGFKARRIGELARAVRHVRDKHGFYDEFKFNTLNDGSRDLAYALIDVLGESDAQLIGCVVDPAITDPFEDVEHRWLAHAEVTAQLIIGSTNRRELVSALLDTIGTPRGCSLEDHVRARVNRRFGATSLVSAVCLDSKTNDLLQLADLVASAVSFERRRQHEGIGSPNSAKGMVAARLGAAFGNQGLTDGRSRRYNIATYGAKRYRRKPSLSVVSGRSA